MHAVLKIRSSRWIQIYYAPKRLLNNIWAREINVFLYASQSWRNRMKFNGTMCPVSFQNLQDITKIFRTSNKLHKRHILHVWDILFNKISLLSFNFINSCFLMCNFYHILLLLCVFKLLKIVYMVYKTSIVSHCHTTTTFVIISQIWF